MWSESGHVLDTSARTWADDVLRRTKWFVVFKVKALGVFEDHDLAKAQIRQAAGGGLKAFREEAHAT